MATAVTVNFRLDKIIHAQLFLLILLKEPFSILYNFHREDNENK